MMCLSVDGYATCTSCVVAVGDVGVACKNIRSSATTECIWKIVDGKYCC